MPLKICVLNASPKGDLSVTMQYVGYMQKLSPSHEFDIINIAQDIHLIEDQADRFSEIMERVVQADAILWAFPVYYFLVPAQYKRFIELIRERGRGEDFRGKYTAVLSTSVHVFDHTAHNYMQAVCDDLGMRYVESFSAEMSDLLKAEGRARLQMFTEHLLRTVAERRPPMGRRYFALPDTPTYLPGEVRAPVGAGAKKILLLADTLTADDNLQRMITRLTELLPEIEVVALDRLDIRGGCLGCIHCGMENICVYQDAYVDFYNSRVRTADILILAGAIHDRYLSATWKMFFDRSFFNNHIPTLNGKQIGFLISGPLSQLPDLRQILESYVELQQSHLVDFVSDEHTSPETDAALDVFARRALEFAALGYIKPPTFIGTGVRKILRDYVWGELRVPFRADHAYYKKHGYYDFPQKDIKTRLLNAVMMLFTSVKAGRRLFVKHIKTEMLRPYRKISP